MPRIRAEGEFLSIAAEDPVCEESVVYGELWMTAVADKLGIGADELWPVVYYSLTLEQAGASCEEVGAAPAHSCASKGDGEVLVFATAIFNKHELVHAIQFAGWPPARPLLREGLAVVFDDSTHSDIDPSWQADLDTLIEGDVQPDTYFAGGWMVHWIIERHGIEGLHDFWLADDKDSSAVEFRALFESHFGESLDEMLTDVGGQRACPEVTCVEDVVPWDGDRWVAESPSACGPGTSGSTGDSFHLERYVLMEVPVQGTYSVAVSESEIGSQGVRIHPCGGPCGQSADDRASFFNGETVDVVWDPGVYRVGMGKVAADDPGVEVEVRLVE